MDFARAFVGKDRFEVVHVTDDRVFEGDAARTEDRARLAADVEGLANVVEFAEADVLREQRAGVFEAAEPQRDEHTLLQLEQHVGQLLLRDLKASDRLAELDSRFCVLERGLKARTGSSHRAPHNTVARLVEAGKRCAEAARFGQHCVRGQPAVFENQFRGDRGAQRELALDVLRAEALCAARYDEAANRAAAAVLAVGPSPHDRDVGETTAGDPRLRTVQDEIAARAASDGAHTGGVAAKIPFGQTETADRLAARHARQPRLLLLLSPELRKREHRKRALDRNEASQAGIARFELAAGETVRDGAGTRAAVAFQMHAE